MSGRYNQIKVKLEYTKQMVILATGFVKISRSNRALTLVLMMTIRVYQLLIAPLLAPSCRFYPSCSSYALESFKQHGILKGLGLSLFRIMKCHPFHPGGYDPVK